MKIEIVPSDANLPLQDGWTRLTEKDFNHYESFFAKHPNILPESADKVHVKYVLETQEYPLIIIRHLDWLLKNGGQLVIDMCTNEYWAGGDFRPYNLICSILSRSFDNRLDQTSRTKDGNIVHCEYVKNDYANPQGDTIDKWTFAICTNGSQNERVLNQIKQINAFEIPQCEIIVCGPAPSDNLPKNVHVIDDSPIYKESEKRYPIGKKKMLIINSAKYNNLMLIHDRFIFAVDWYQKMRDYGNYFDVLMPPMFSIEYEGYRAGGDWKIADLYNFKKIPDDRNIPYEKYDYRICANGGLILGKLDKIKRVPLEDAYYWDEAEDVIWSAQVTSRNYLLQVDVHNKIYTFTHSSGISPNTDSLLYKLRRQRFYYERQLCLHNNRAQLIRIKSPIIYRKDWWAYWFYKIVCNICRHMINDK